MSRYQLVRVDGQTETPIVSLDVFRAVGADYLAFINGITAILLHERQALETEANRAGRTIEDPFFNSLGSSPLSPIAFPH
jgi:hypothetical protein